MAEKPKEGKPVCGIVMPMSAIDGCPEVHWADVLEIINEAIDDAGFDANLVSNADEVGIIQKRIVQNLYDNPVVVCDVSGKNPNVMFELGLRLAFDKPTIVVKDDKTAYAFDTSPIEHLSYPRDLRFAKIVEFKAKLKDKIKATHSKAETEPNFSTFLKAFGEFKIAKLEQTEVPAQELVLDELRSMRQLIRRLDFQSRHRRPVVYEGEPRDLELHLEGLSSTAIQGCLDQIAQLPGVYGARIRNRGEGHDYIQVRLVEDAREGQLELLIHSIIEDAKHAGVGRSARARPLAKRAKVRKT